MATKSKKTETLMALIEKAIVDTGRYKEAIEIAGIHPSTFSRWIKTDTKFRQMVTHALERHDKLNLRSRTDLKEKAVASLESLLSERKVKKSEVKIIKNYDKSGKLLGHKEETIQRDVIRDPSYYAIEKVLGKREIEYIVLSKAIEQGKEDKDSPVFKRIFGDWGKDNVLTDGFEDNIFSDTIDLIKLRQAQLETQKRYDQGRLSFEEWEKMVRDQSKDYVTMKDKIERRAIGLIEGYTPQELIMQIRQFTFMIIQTLEEVINDVGIDRADIPAELGRKIRKKSELSAAN